MTLDRHVPVLEVLLIVLLFIGLVLIIAIQQFNRRVFGRYVAERYTGLHAQLTSAEELAKGRHGIVTGDATLAMRKFRETGDDFGDAQLAELRWVSMLLSKVWIGVCVASAILIAVYVGLRFRG